MMPLIWNVQPRSMCKMGMLGLNKGHWQILKKEKLNYLEKTCKSLQMKYCFVETTLKVKGKK